MMSERIRSGILGLDERMQGGFIDGSIILVTGKTGTGKTAFSSNFIYQGLYDNQPAVYITTEEREEDLRADIYDMFGWDMAAFEEQGLLGMKSMKPLFPSKEIENINRLVRSYLTDLMNEINTAIDTLGAERVVIDSISIIEMFINDPYLSRVSLASLLNNLRKTGATTLLTGTVPETSEGLSGGGIIEFLVDTVLLLEFVPVAEGHNRTLTIRKMRRTDHDVSIMPFEFASDGIQIMDVE